MNFYSKGSWPAVMTAFQKNSALDFSAQEALLNHYIETGGAGLFINCYSSELFSLTIPEQLELARHAMKFVGGRCEVVSGAILSGTIEKQYELIDQLLATGVDGLILGSNQLVAEDESDALLLERLHAVIDRYPDVRWGLYEIPFPYKRVLSDEVLQVCADSGHFYFLKDTCCDLATIHRRVSICEGSPLRLFNAHLGTLCASLEAGYAGYCGVLSNLIPETMAGICTHSAQGEQSVVSDLESEALLIDKAVLAAGVPYPQCAKAFLAAQGVPVSDTCRMAQTGDADRIEETVAAATVLLDEKRRTSQNE